MTPTAEQSTLSFVGRVDSVTDPVTDPAAGSSGETVVEVTIEELIGEPSALGDIVGRQVVVLLPEGASMTVGERRLFRTIGVSYGDTLTLRAVEILPADDASAHRAEEGPDRRLAAELARADSVVVGEIVRLDEPVPDSRLTEHEPGLAAALVRVDETLKGTPRDVVAVMLPTSFDVLWAGWPSPRKGERAVFVLRNASAADAGPDIDVIAVHPIEALDEVRTVIQES